MEETFVLVKYVHGVPFFYCGHQVKGKDCMSINFNESALFLSEHIAKYVNQNTVDKNYEIESHGF